MSSSIDRRYAMSSSPNFWVEFGAISGLKLEAAKYLRYRVAFEEGSVHSFSSSLEYLSSLLLSKGFGESGRHMTGRNGFDCSGV